MPVNWFAWQTPSVPTTRKHEPVLKEREPRQGVALLKQARQQLYGVVAPLTGTKSPDPEVLTLKMPSPPLAVLMMLAGPQTAWRVCWGATVDSVAGKDVSFA